MLHVCDTDNVTITLGQSGLAQNIVEALIVNGDKSPVETRANKCYLLLDKDDEQAHGLYTFESVVGICGYFQDHYCYDVIFSPSKFLTKTFVLNNSMS